VKLTRQAVVDAALDLLDEVGLDGLTLRVVAGRLDVRAPALYWHVENKRALIDQLATAMVDTAFGGITAPERPSMWVEWLAELARAYRSMLLGRRDGARVMTSAHPDDPTTDRMTELVLRTLTAAGFTTDDAMRALESLTSYVTGFVLSEQSARPVRELDPVLFPLLTDANVRDRTTTFEYGLELLLGGLRLARLR
jgi:TetR/AcrR family transcriptional regulator, tetracycline repressor protein